MKVLDNHTWPWKFFSEGERSKKFLGGCGGDLNVRSTIREGNFFLFCFQIFKNQEWNLQVSVAGGYGQGCKINFQIGDLDRVSIKFFRRGTWIGIIAKFLEGGNALGRMSIIKKKSKFLFFHQFLAIFQLIFVLDFLQRED